MGPCSTCCHARPIPYAPTRIGCHQPAINRHLGAGPAPTTATDGFWFYVNFEPAKVISCTGQAEPGSAQKAVAR